MTKPFREHDSFNPECWCGPYILEDGDLIVHNDEREKMEPMETVAPKGLKYDSDKPRMDLLDNEFLVAVSEVLGFGAKKYSPDNWRHGIEFRRIIGAAYRHLGAISSGEDIDPESNLRHVGHLGCCIMFLTWMMNHRPDLDDRYKGEKA